jgi:hypothetical protein
MSAPSALSERRLHTREVAGSKPAAPIVRKPCICGAFVVSGVDLSRRLRGVIRPAGAQWCPMASVDECLQGLLVARVAAHRVGVHTQGERRVGVPELPHHVRRVLAAHEQDRGERVAQLVRGHAGRERLAGAPGEQRVGVRDDRPDDAFAGVVLVAAAAR